MVTIYHNPHCSKSRETLKLLHEQGVTVEVVLYLETPPDQPTLQSLLGLLGMKSARELIRPQEEIHKTLNLSNPTLSETQLLQAITHHPILIERPIVVANGKARIGRPPEKVLEILVRSPIS